MIFKNFADRTGSDSIFSDQDWTRTEKFVSPLISALKSVTVTHSILYHMDFMLNIFTDTQCKPSTDLHIVHQYNVATGLSRMDHKSEINQYY